MIARSVGATPRKRVLLGVRNGVVKVSSYVIYCCNQNGNGPEMILIRLSANFVIPVGSYTENAINKLDDAQYQEAAMACNLLLFSVIFVKGTLHSIHCQVNTFILQTLLCVLRCLCIA